VKPVPFGSLFEFIRNGASIKQDPALGGVPVSRIETISAGWVDPERVGYAGVSIDGYSKHLLADGDILFSHINSPAHVGKCAIYRSDPPVLIHGMNLLRLRCKPGVDPAFVRFLIGSPGFRASLQPFINRAVNQASISVANLSQIDVVVPSLGDQRRIARVLGAAEQLIVRHQTALPLVLSLLESRYTSLHDTAPSNTRWPLACLGEVAKITTGNTPPRKDRENFGDTIEWIKNDNVQLDWPYVTTAEEGLSSRGAAQARIAEPGSILITCISGSARAIGRAALVDRQVAFNQQINAVAPVGLEPAALYVQLRLSRNRIRSLSTGGMKGMISKRSLEGLEMRVPPVPVQAALEESFRHVVDSATLLRRRAGVLDALFSSLQHRAFVGAL
jgi:type I restriction enzyme S subunit